MVERCVRDAEAAGSNPVISTKNPRSSERGFFIHCESNGISSPIGVYHHASACISSAVGCIFFRNDDMQNLRFDDMQFLVELMIYKAYALIKN